jgi:hypothetical protein
VVRDLGLIYLIDLLAFSAVLLEIQEKNVDLHDSEFLSDLCVRLEWAGIIDVNNKIYIQPPEISNIEFLIFLLTVPQLQKLYFCKNTGRKYSIRNVKCVRIQCIKQATYFIITYS